MPALNHHRKFKFCHKTFLFFGAVVLTLALLEAGFRIARINGDYHQARVDRVVPIKELVRRAPFGFYTNTAVISRYDSNPRGYFGPGNTIIHRHNSVGWRDDEHALDKPDGTFRILGLGDSYLWGQGVKFEDICLTKLRFLLQKTMPDKTIETINAGISGFNTADELQQLKRSGLAYYPDLIILHFTLNDVEDDLYREGPKVEFFNNYTYIYQSPDWFSRISYVWSWSRYRILKYTLAERYIQECVDSFNTDSIGWRHCQQALNDLRMICKENDIPLCVVIFPFFIGLDGGYPFQPVHEIVAEYCQSLGIPVLDLRRYYKEFRGPELWVHPTDQHPNEIAHDIAAHAIADYLKANATDLLITTSKK